MLLAIFVHMGMLNNLKNHENFTLKKKEKYVRLDRKSSIEGRYHRKEPDIE